MKKRCRIDLSDLLERDVDVSSPRPYILDGSKRCTRRRTPGRRGRLHPALVGAQGTQFCSITRRRNTRPAYAGKPQKAYAMRECDPARQALAQLHRELIDLNWSAARSPGSGTGRLGSQPA